LLRRHCFVGIVSSALFRRRFSSALFVGFLLSALLPHYLVGIDISALFRRHRFVGFFSASLHNRTLPRLQSG
jgi:hypothetical protein